MNVGEGKYIVTPSRFLHIVIKRQSDIVILKIHSDIKYYSEDFRFVNIRTSNLLLNEIGSILICKNFELYVTRIRDSIVYSWTRNANECGSKYLYDRSEIFNTSKIKIELK